jgi:hypothetical protein
MKNLNNIIAILFFNYTIVESFKLDSHCEENPNMDTCLNNWNCGWCNITNISNTNDKYLDYLLSFNSSCMPILPCFSNNNILDNCEISRHYMCDFIYVFLNIVIIFGFFASVSMLLYTIDKLLTRERITKNTKNSIQCIFLILIVLPIFVLFCLNEEFFLYLFIGLIFFSILSCIFNIGQSRISINNYDERNKLLN